MSHVERAKALVLDRILMAKRLGGLYHAEAAGLLRALYCEQPSPQIYSRPDLQARYLLGFRDGRTILQCQSRVTAEPVGAVAEQGY